ncbi:MAG: acetylxylan esterase [Puia sp.]|nr:acetylxylan esterase [Puia sp.]
MHKSIEMTFKTCRILFLLPACLLIFFHSHAQPSEQIVKLVVSPDHQDWTYEPGEKVKFEVSVFQYGHLVKNTGIRYEVGPEKMPPVKKDSVFLAGGKATLDGGTLKTPGFLRCIVVAVVNGKEYRGLATAGFSPASIQPTVAMPEDFQQFWDKAKADNAGIPMDARMTLLPDRCTGAVNVYQVNLQNYKPGARLYGILCVPKKEGKYPAVLEVPGAGVRPYSGDIKLAEKGVITLQIGIHGVPVIMDRQVYDDMSAGWLNAYWTYNMEDKDQYYFKRVYLGCVRANDFLVSLPQYDGTNLGVTGGSQGGALSIVTASLDPRVKCLAAFYPALCDMTGYLHGRAGGWPHIFDQNNPQHRSDNEIANMAYFDVLNFAKLLKAPGMYSWGYNDEVCPPTSTFAAYNQITAPKSLFLSLETGHWSFPEQNEKLTGWLLQQLGKEQLGKE